MSCYKRHKPLFHLSIQRQKGKGVLFDNCSQKSFVNNDVKEQLKLPVIKSENLSIKVFSSTKTNLEKLGVVQLKIQSRSK